MASIHATDVQGVNLTNWNVRQALRIGELVTFVRSLPQTDENPAAVRWKTNERFVRPVWVCGKGSYEDLTSFLYTRGF